MQRIHRVMTDDNEDKKEDKEEFDWMILIVAFYVISLFIFGIKEDIKIKIEKGKLLIERIINYCKKVINEDK